MRKEKLIRFVPSSRWLIRLLFGLLAVLWAHHLFASSWTRDEGFYLIVARLVGEGKELYRDLIYGHFPLYPPLLRIWQAFFGGGLIAGRWFSFVFSVLLVCMAWRILVRAGVSIGGRVAFVILLLTHSLSWACLLNLKPYALCFASVLTGWCLACEGDVREGWKKNGLLVASGLFFGLAANVRVFFFFPALIVALRWIRRPAVLLPWVTGFLLACVPTFLAMVRYPDQAFFSWFGFHQDRSALGGSSGVWGRRYFGILRSFAGPEWASLLGLGIWGFVLSIVKKVSWKPGRVWFLFAATTTLPALRLVPFYGDYLIPIAIFGLLGLFVVFAGEPWFERGGLVAALISILLWLPMVRWDGSKENQEVANSRRNVAAAAAAIQDLTRPGDEVLSFWSGYLVGTHATILPGMLDGQAVELMNGKLSQEEHHRYGVASREDILAWIETRRPALIVVSFASPAGFEDLVSRKYRLARVAGQARLYVR